MNTTQLGERIAELAARINIATHEMLTLVAEFDRREGWADAFDSCAEWLAWRTGRTVATCRENVRVAHALEDLPATSAEMKAGRLSYAKARAITRVATPRTEAELLDYARKGSAAAVERMVRGVKHLSRDGEIGAEEARHRARTLSVVIAADGTYVVRGRLEPEAGAVLMRAIEAASDALYRGEDPDARPRSRQRRADAMGLVAERALAAGLGAGADAREEADAGEAIAEATPSGTRAERYQVTVHTEMATLEEGGEGGRSELDGVRVSAETSRRMACDASLVGMLHREGKVVSVGRKTRTIPPHLRRALEERDRGCRYPACGSRFTEAHHVRHWADGGETSLANTVLLCRRHHRLVHEGRVRMALDRHGRAVFFARSGAAVARWARRAASQTRRWSRPASQAMRWSRPAGPTAEPTADARTPRHPPRPPESRVSAANPGTQACRDGTGWGQRDSRNNRTGRESRRATTRAGKAPWAGPLARPRSARGESTPPAP